MNEGGVARHALTARRRRKYTATAAADDGTGGGAGGGIMPLHVYRCDCSAARESGMIPADTIIRSIVVLIAAIVDGQRNDGETVRIGVMHYLGF